MDLKQKSSGPARPVLNVLIADDQTLFREGLRLLLKRFDAFSDTIFAAGSLPEVEDVLERHPEIDLLLIDLHMPGMQGMLSIRHLAQQYPELKILVISANESPIVMRACLQAGASGYVPKSAKPSLMMAAIDLILDGGSYIPREALHVRPLKLSTRQEQILIQLAAGASNREIAEALGLREGTVKQYVSELLHLLDVENRTQASIKAREILGIGIA